MTVSPGQPVLAQIAGPCVPSSDLTEDAFRAGILVPLACSGFAFDTKATKSRLLSGSECYGRAI